MQKKLNTLQALLTELTSQLVGITSSFFPPSRKISQTVIKRLRQEVASFSVSHKDKSLSPLNIWQQYLSEVQSLISKQDPNSFLRWPLIRKSMFVGNEAYVMKELSDFRRDNWQFWKKVLKKSDVGTPPFFLPEPSSTSNTTHLAYHLFCWLQHTSQKISGLEVIVEFGGGFGELARICYQAGFRGTYIIFDFPTFLSLQKAYLTSNHIKIGDIKKPKPNAKAVYFVSDAKQLKKLLRKFDQKKEQLCVATWSLSESPISIRKSFLSAMSKMKYYLLAYHLHFEKINNKTFFRQWQAKKKKFTWNETPIEHIPGNNYLFGEKH